MAAILALDGGEYLPALVCGPCRNPQARTMLKEHKPKDLFPASRDARAATAGLYLYWSCFEEAHQLVDDPRTPEATYWHAILHRQEPDSGNAAYWFRQLRDHPIFEPLATEARDIIERNPTAEFRLREWDAFAFINFCERAVTQPGSIQEKAAREIQRVEWQLLFDHTARRA